MYGKNEFCVKLVIYKNYRINVISTFCCSSYYYFLTTQCTTQAYCAIWVRRSSFNHQASPRVSPRESTQRRKVELWARNVR